MQVKYCDQVPNENDSVAIQHGEGFEEFGIDISVRSRADNHHDGAEGEVFYSNPFQTPSNSELHFHAFCGNVTYARRQVLCTPQPDAFK